MGTSHGVYHSQDLKEWTPLNKDLPRYIYLSTEGSEIETLKFLDGELYANPRTYIDGLFRYDKDNKKWTSLHRDSQEIEAFSKVDTVLLTATLSTMYRSTDDGQTWNTSNLGINTSNAFHREMVETDSGVFLLSPDLYFSDNGGAEWQLVNEGTNYTKMIEGPNDGALLITRESTKEGVFFLSKSGTEDSLVYKNDFVNNLIDIEVGYLANSTYYNNFKVVFSPDGFTWKEVQMNFDFPTNTIMDAITRDDTLFVTVSYDGLYYRPLTDFIINDSPSTIYFSHEGSSELTINWSSSGQDIEYLVYREDADTTMQVTTTTDTLFVDQNVTAGERYQYFIIPGPLDLATSSDTVAIYFPRPVDEVRVLDVDTTSFTLEIEGESHIGYRLDLAADTLFSSILESYNDILVEDTVFKASGLEHSTSYSVRITAISQYGFTDRVVYKNIVTTETPLPPLGNGNDDHILTIYPNPTSRHLIIEGLKNEVVFVSDIKGQKLDEIVVENEYLELPAYRTGIYYLHIPGIKKAFKLIIEN